MTRATPRPLRLSLLVVWRGGLLSARNQTVPAVAKWLQLSGDVGGLATCNNSPTSSMPIPRN